MASNTSDLKRSFYVFERSKEGAETRGPFHPSHIKDLLAANALDPDFLVASDTNPEWIPIAEHPLQPIVSPVRSKLGLQAPVKQTAEPEVKISAKDLLDSALSEEQKEERARTAAIKPPSRFHLAFGSLGKVFLSGYYGMLVATLIHNAAFFYNGGGWTNDDGAIAILLFTLDLGLPFVHLLHATGDAGTVSLIIVLTGAVVALFTHKRPFPWTLPIIWAIVVVPLFVLSTSIPVFDMFIHVILRTPICFYLSAFIMYRAFKKAE